MNIDPEQHERLALLARLPAVDPCRVVEVGCGDGRLTRRYAARVASVLAIDSDEAEIAAFRAAGVNPNVTVRAIPIEKLALTQRSVDTVVFAWSL